MNIDINLVEDCRRLAKQCKMNALIEELQNKCKQVYEFGEKLRLPALCAQLYHFSVSRHYSPPPPSAHIVSRVLISPPLVSNKPGVCVKVLSLESNSSRLQEDMAQLADCAIPPDLRVRSDRVTVAAADFVK